MEMPTLPSRIRIEVYDTDGENESRRTIHVSNVKQLMACLKDQVNELTETVKVTFNVPA